MTTAQRRSSGVERRNKQGTIKQVQKQRTQSLKKHYNQRSSREEKKQARSKQTAGAPATTMQ